MGGLIYVMVLICVGVFVHLLCSVFKEEIEDRIANMIGLVLNVIALYFLVDFIWWS